MIRAQRRFLPCEVVRSRLEDRKVGSVDGGDGDIAIGIEKFDTGDWKLFAAGKMRDRSFGTGHDVEIGHQQT